MVSREILTGKNTVLDGAGNLKNVNLKCFFAHSVIAIGSPVGPGVISSISAYVQQDDMVRDKYNIWYNISF